MGMLQGLTAATFTPFDEKGNLKLGIVDDYVEYLIRSGINALYVCGTTGEGVNMTVSERQQVAEAFIRAVNDRIPVVVQVGANSLVDCRELAAHAESVGATAVSANAPSYFRIDSTKILADCMTEIAAAAPKTPFYYYHIPSFTGVSVDMTEFLTLMETQSPQFAGIKYTDTKVFAYQEAITYNNGKYEILWGCDEMLLAGLVVGGKGGVGSTYGLAPALYRKILDAWDKNDLETARQWQRRSWEMVKVLLRYGHILPTQKAVMKMLGFDFGTSRLPITPLKSDAESQIRADLEKIGFFNW